MTPAERTRRYRERRRQGLAVVPVPIDEVDVPEYLIELGWLDRQDEDDPEAIGRAIGEYLDHQARV